MEKSKIWDILKNILKVLITLAALYWVSTKISLGELTEALKNSNFLYLFFALLAYICSILVASSRLNSFFAAIGLKLTERYNFRLYQLGLLYNFFLPGGIGGGRIQNLLLEKEFSDLQKKSSWRGVF
ncbi:lysylphosphatidylglycerol synthase domain-containing protein [Sphingobacterium daejeonense]|uniref:lysylphosphatidylglycerol synthase domain-containing protein n=1 Tax=Sphingobacterium daejeonense TaxID=371142 RepID=UPI0010C356FE|nr:lysylphosphatidylglycerol synthase domain-containing protein [Sphingobacterium daejeonense]VTQ05296.1 Uncharacterised protein family (UPF0104) [Sphingobacterium daejeonense]